MRRAETGRASSVVKAFTKIIICEIAVLNESASMSSPTFLIVAWMTFCWARVGSRLGDCGGEDPFARLVFLHDQAPDAREEARDALHAFHAPWLHLLERAHEHLVTTERVGAVFGDDIERIDHVAPALRHFAAVLAEDDALIDEPLERLRRREMPEIEEDLVPEPRIQEMQHGVLGAADVEIDAAGCATAVSADFREAPSAASFVGRDTLRPSHPSNIVRLLSRQSVRRSAGRKTAGNTSTSPPIAASCLSRALRFSE